MTTKVTLNLEIPPKMTVSRLAQILTPVNMRRINEAIGNRLAQITRSNFGPTGAHRAQSWLPLTRRYQQRIKYFGPPKLVLSQKLVRSVGVSSVGVDHVTVSAGSGINYAEIHQHGNFHIPMRPYFPIEGKKLTNWAEDQLIRAAQAEMLRLAP